MTNYEIATLVVSGLAFIMSGISLYFSLTTQERHHKETRKDAADALSEQRTRDARADFKERMQRFLDCMAKTKVEAVSPKVSTAGLHCSNPTMKSGRSTRLTGGAIHGLQASSESSNHNSRGRTRRPCSTSGSR